MNILAIDPGNELSGFVLMNDGLEIFEKGKVDNYDLINKMHETEWRFFAPDILLVEMVASYGMAVGQTVFDTCVWIGYFHCTWDVLFTGKRFSVYRKKPNKIDKIDSVAMTMCKSTRAKDTNVRQAVLDRFPSTGGGKTPQVGTKACPGPLYGVSGDVWSALAVALTFLESECYMKLTSKLETLEDSGDNLF